MTTTLGLDVGPNSVGWALIDESACRLIDMGVRIFPEGVDNFDQSKEKSPNEDRRSARSMRRQIARRSRRKTLLRAALIEADLWPEDVQLQAQFEALDPYPLRALAVNPKAPPLSRFELGRIILHLNQRRGFLSNRKADKAKAKENSDIKAEISELAQRLGQGTLGQYLARKAAVPGENRSHDDRVRRWHTHRDMFEKELLDIAQRHGDILTDKLLFGCIGKQPLAGAKPRHIPKSATRLQTFGIHGLIFFQRALYWPRSMVGLCELEPGERRCPRADRSAQRFRLLQEVNNLRYTDPDTQDEKSLDAPQRALLLDKLCRKEKIEFIGKTGIKVGILGFLETVRFNLEHGDRTYLQGHIVDVRMAKAVKDWHDRPEAHKDAIVRLLLNPALAEQTLRDRLTRDFELSSDQAQTAMAVDLPDQYIHLSLKAVQKLLPHMERGLVYQAIDSENSALHAAGYLRADQLQRRIFDKLPDPARTRQSPIGDLPNPVVRRALVEMRHLVNAIIRQFGKPDAIHVEMIREVKQGRKARQACSKNMRERQARRDAAADSIREHGIKVTRDAIDRYLLWQEQNQRCAYSDQVISMAQLFGGEADMDHILPYSRCLDDSMMNKVVCLREQNALKGQRTPYEWLGHTPRFESLCQRANRLPYPKYRRFLQKELELDKFIARQLVDTAYISRATAEYLRCLMDQPHKVLGLKGQLTAELRHQWGLNDLLGGPGSAGKSRDDHRHHAVDALVIALTNRSRLQPLTRIRKAGGMTHTGESLPYPWDNFRELVAQRVQTIYVSHRANRKAAGALHEETLYSQHRNDAGKIVPGEFVSRKPLESLSPNEIENIRDQGVRRSILERLALHGIEVGRGKKVEPARWKAALCDPDKPVRLIGKTKGTLGPPIRKVRVVRAEQTIQPIRLQSNVAYVKPGGTHHLSLFEWEENGKTQRDSIFTTQLEALNRIRQRTALLREFKQGIKAETGKNISIHDPRLGQEMRRIEALIPQIIRHHPQHPEACFLFSLRRGEAVLALIDGREELLIYNTAASTTKNMVFFKHNDAHPSKERKTINKSPNTLEARKVVIDYLGRLRWAND